MTNIKQPGVYVNELAWGKPAVKPVTRKYFITKYALTKGIFVVEGYVDVDRNMLIVSKGTSTFYYHGDDFHNTYQLAVAHAIRMRERRIAAVTKQLKRLELLAWPDQFNGKML